MVFNIPQRFVTQSDIFAPPAAVGGTVAVKYGAFTYLTITQTTLFTLPQGAVPLDWWIDVLTDFDSGTNNNLKIGIASDDDYFATALAIGTQGIFRAGAANTVFGRLGIQLIPATGVSVTYAPTGTPPTAGAAKLFVSYMLRSY